MYNHEDCFKAYQALCQYCKLFQKMIEKNLNLLAVDHPLTVKMIQRSLFDIYNFQIYHYVLLSKIHLKQSNDYYQLSNERTLLTVSFVYNNLKQGFRSLNKKGKY